MNANYETIIGLEVHVQLRTQTKLFCRCSTQFGADPNTQTCPVCLGLPGSLPVLNEQAIRLAALAGFGLQSDISKFTKWDRKNYFYPDLPKGYQISQFDLPICVGGYIDVKPTDSSGETETQRVRLVRAHLEEDAGKSMHSESGSASENASSADTRIDLNRTGTPLLEIVSEPDLRTAENAKQYLIQLREMMLYLGVSDCNMQEGSLRCDANVNIRLEKEGETVATPIAEIKNLNSFRSVERAIEFEANRQYHQFQKDGKCIGERPKQTRGWDEAREVTTLQREKEESDEYRYFPDPDLAPVSLSDIELNEIKSTMVELPDSRRERYVRELSLSQYDADVIVSAGRDFSDFFEQVVAGGVTAKRASSWMQQDVTRVLNDREILLSEFPISNERLAELIGRVDSIELNNSQARKIFQYLLDHADESIDDAISTLGLESVDTSELEQLCRELLEQNADVVAKVQAGNAKAVGALVGQAKKKNRNADPQLVQQICLKLIEEL